MVRLRIDKLVNFYSEKSVGYNSFTWNQLHRKSVVFESSMYECALSIDGEMIILVDINHAMACDFIECLER